MKFEGEICGGVLVENASDDFPQQKKLENILPNFAVTTNFAENFANFTLEIAGADIGGIARDWIANREIVGH